jgi:hypothetical protein
VSELHLEDIGVYGTLKWIFKEKKVLVLSVGLTGSGWGPVVDTCEYGS